MDRAALCFGSDTGAMTDERLPLICASFVRSVGGTGGLLVFLFWIPLAKSQPVRLKGLADGRQLCAGSVCAGLWPFVSCICVACCLDSVPVHCVLSRSVTVGWIAC